MKRWLLGIPLIVSMIVPLQAADREAGGEPPPDPALLEMLGQRVALEAMGVRVDELVEAHLRQSPAAEPAEDN